MFLYWWRRIIKHSMRQLLISAYHAVEKHKKRSRRNITISARLPCSKGEGIIRRLFISNSFLVILSLLHGAILVAICCLGSMSSFEDGIFDQIVEFVAPNETSQEQRALKLLQTTHTGC